MNRRKRLLAVGLVLSLALLGCAARPIHPGAANKFDSDCYDALIVADSIIQSTKTDLANNVFPANVVPNIKTALNGLITAYNATDVAYQAYHAAAISGGVSAAQQAAVSTGLSQVSASMTALVNAKRQP